MRIQLIENTATGQPHRLEIEAPWETVAPDYNDACAVYRNVALPGFRAGRAPLSVIAQKFSREIRADAARSCAARLTRDAIREKHIRAMGGIAVTEATLAPGQPFRCTAEFTLRPEIKLPDYRNNLPAPDSASTQAPADPSARRDEIADWLLANTQFLQPIPAPVSTNIAAQSDAQAAAEPDENETRLLIITREIADREGITLEEHQLTARLTLMAADAGAPLETFRANLEKAGALESIREFLLAETVLDHLAGLSPAQAAEPLSAQSTNP